MNNMRMKIPTMIFFVMLFAAAVECPPFGEHVQLAGTRDQAETECEQREGRSLPSGHWVQDVQPAMLSRDVPTLWLSPRLHVMDEPEWIDGHVIEPGENFLGNCGYYVPRDDAVEMTDCNKGPYGFICNLKARRDCEMCDDGHPSVQCFRRGDDCYALYYKSQNWYEARAHCQRQGGDLVVLSSKKLKKKIRAEVKLNDGTHFWVGLRQENWSWEDSEKDALRTYWLPGQPSPKLFCMVAARADDGRSGWKTASCTELHRSVCVEDNAPKDTNDDQPDERGKDFNNGNLTRLCIAAVQRQELKLDYVIRETKQVKHGFESVWLMLIISININMFMIAVAVAFYQRQNITRIYGWVCNKLRRLQSGTTSGPDVKTNAEEIGLTAGDTQRDQDGGASGVQTESGTNLQQEAGDLMFPVNQSNK